MIFSYNWLKSFFKSPLPQPEKLAEILTMHSFENETLEKKKGDYLLGIDVLPDRAGDCLSHLGIARECSALLDKKIILPSIKINEDKKLKIKDFLSVKVEKPKDCPRYTVRVLTEVNVCPSPNWLKEKLLACGLNSINNVVDATNYVMLEMGQPLHAFDYDKVGKEIIVRRAGKGERIMTLSGKEYVLDKDTLLISDPKRPLALAGIKGGIGAEITNATKTIILESANFNPKLISQTARRLNLRTDASMRFEHNLDPNLTEAAIDRVASIIKEVAGAKVISGKIDVYKNKVKPKKIKLNFGDIKRIIGVEISRMEIVKILSKLGFEVSGTGDLSVLVPTFRQDVVIPENLIEEIGRVYGYDKILSILPYSYLEPATRNEELFWQNKSKDVFKELGFSEIYTYSFVGDEEKGIFNFEAEEIINPVSGFYKYLRPTLVPQMMKIAKENLKFFNDLKIFELNTVFIKSKKIREKMMLSGAVAGYDFYYLKDCLNVLFGNLNIKVSYESMAGSLIWHNNKTAEIKIGNESIGYIGYLAPDIMDVLNIKKEVLAFELDFDKLQKHASEKREYQQISYHPPAMRDISGVVPEKIKIEEIMETIKKNGGGLLKSVEVFDIYKGKGIPEDKKSVSFHLIYQSEEKTLDPKTIDSLHDGLINKLKEAVNWEERK